MPPVVRGSARFWKTTRYFRGAAAPSMGGASRAIRAADAVVDRKVISLSANVFAARPMGPISRERSTPSIFSWAAATWSSARCRPAPAAISGSRGIRPLTGTIAAGVTVVAASSSSGAVLRATSSTVPAMVPTVRRLGPTSGSSPAKR